MSVRLVYLFAGECDCTNADGTWNEEPHAHCDDCDATTTDPDYDEWEIANDPTATDGGLVLCRECCKQARRA